MLHLNALQGSHFIQALCNLPVSLVCSRDHQEQHVAGHNVWDVLGCEAELAAEQRRHDCLHRKWPSACACMPGENALLHGMRGRVEHLMTALYPYILIYVNLYGSAPMRIVGLMVVSAMAAALLLLLHA